MPYQLCPTHGGNTYKDERTFLNEYTYCSLPSEAASPHHRRFAQKTDFSVDPSSPESNLIVVVLFVVELVGNDVFP